MRRGHRRGSRAAPAVRAGRAHDQRRDRSLGRAHLERRRRGRRLRRLPQRRAARQADLAGYIAGNLAPATPYTFTVRARDRRGQPDHRLARRSRSRRSPPIPTTGDAYAFLLATVDSSFQDLQRHVIQIGTISPTYFEVLRDGTIGGKDDPLVTGWARLHGVKVEPRFHTEDPTTQHALLSDPGRRAPRSRRASPRSAR